MDKAAEVELAIKVNDPQYADWLMHEHPKENFEGLLHAWVWRKEIHLLRRALQYFRWNLDEVYQHQSPLQIAIETRQHEMAKHLLVCGANPNMVTWDMPQSPLEEWTKPTEYMSHLDRAVKMFADDPCQKTFDMLYCVCKHGGRVYIYDRFQVRLSLEWHRTAIRTLLRGGLDIEVVQFCMGDKAHMYVLNSLPEWKKEFGRQPLE